MEFKDGVFGKKLVMRMDTSYGINGLIRRKDTRTPSVSVMWGHCEKAVIRKIGRESSPGNKSASTLILDFPAFRTVKISVILKHPVYVFLLW